MAVSAVPSVVEIRDQETAGRFLLQGLLWQRHSAVSPSRVRIILEWTLEIAAAGQPLPPTGIIADVGHLAFGVDRVSRSRTADPGAPALPAQLLRQYEDYVLGKLYADSAFEQASDAMRRFQGRDRAKGLAYVLRQIHERWGMPGIELPPGVVRGLLDSRGDDLLRSAVESTAEHGPLPLLVQAYQSWVSCARGSVDVLAREDVTALEQRTALADQGQYVAHRQIVQMAGRIESALPARKIRPRADRREVPTRITDEDTYPVGGFSSISTKGTVESLLHSQLAYMEKDLAQRPDLFDIKFVRDELYYYSRDDNEFRRRRRSFLFVLRSDLTSARFKDPELPCQRIVLIQSAVTAMIHKLVEWLSTDAVQFEIIFPYDAEKKHLDQESDLFEMLFREAVENETVVIRRDVADIPAYAADKARRSQCRLLDIAVAGDAPTIDSVGVVSIRVAGPRPVVRFDGDPPITLEGDEAFDGWVDAVEKILAEMV